MVSKAVANLSKEDLVFLEKLLGNEFCKLNEHKQQFKTKNGWCPNETKTKTILRLMNAVRAQKNLLTMPKW